MKIAIPLHQGALSLHFGHCEHFVLVEVDTENGKILGKTFHEPPPHEPGVLPKWLAELGTDLIIAGGMGPGIVCRKGNFGPGRRPGLLPGRIDRGLPGRKPADRGKLL
jgi:hypothetical protein